MKVFTVFYNNGTYENHDTSDETALQEAKNHWEGNLFNGVRALKVQEWTDEPIRKLAVNHCPPATNTNRYYLTGSIYEPELHCLNLAGFESYQAALNAMASFGYVLYR